ncbi:L-histidine N(alpha)-methyltransferase [Sphingomonas sp. 28-63-12]|uniref:L-histidine N(alpha)-methyltransferase n=1 Tax=Sphingomonas sp. 28-63-12 TaxID=1970434 RepID=UPI000BC866A6|nr:MAG: L-histidine N(alpha)-methyltransferase [Sphingomonas sp. 28-63-12]
MLKPEIEDGEVSLADPGFRADVLNGFASRPRAIPARWFYDRRGSELFEAITDLPEYYPTRVEASILRDNGPAIADRVGAGHAVVEFGSGSSAKTPLLLRAIAPAAYVPIDISGDFLRESSAQLSQAFPGLPVHPIEADFMHPIALPVAVADLPKLGFFPGSTIGNMIPSSAVDLLRAMRLWLGTGAMLLIGMDRLKGEDVLVPAYDDAQGVTAAFNLNLLERINRELDGTIPVEAFRHRAIWNDMRARIEMHLEATEDVSFTIEKRPFAMGAGETIHTENSHKYGDRDARILLRAGGWTPIAEWTDADDRFALILAEAQAPRTAP